MKTNLIGVYLLFIFGLLNSFSKGISFSISKSPDSVFIDTNKLWFDKHDHLLVGFGMDYRNYDITFKNTATNLIGKLQQFGFDGFNYKVTDWKFFPTINQNNASVFINTKYGSFGLSKAIKPTDNQNYTKTTALSITIPYGSFYFSFDYLKFTGLNRIEPVYNRAKFFESMTFRPITFTIEFRNGRLRNNLLYVPKKMVYSFLPVLSYTRVVIQNSSDFIPALQYKNNNKLDSIVEVDGVFMNKFTSGGFCLGIKASILLPILKSKGTSRPNVLYFKGLGFYGYNMQAYKYHTMVDTITQYEVDEKKNGFDVTVNYGFNGLLIYDANICVIGFGASYKQQSYGRDNQFSAKDENHVSDTRLYFNGFISFRFGAKRLFGKIDTFKNRLFH